MGEVSRLRRVSPSPWRSRWACSPPRRRPGRPGGADGTETRPERGRFGGQLADHPGGPRLPCSAVGVLLGSPDGRPNPDRLAAADPAVAHPRTPPTFTRHPWTTGCTTGPRLPLGWVAVLFLAAGPWSTVLMAIVLWLFPDGRLPAGRWHGVSVCRGHRGGCWPGAVADHRAPGLAAVGRPRRAHRRPTGTCTPVSAGPGPSRGNITSIAALGEHARLAGAAGTPATGGSRGRTAPAS